MIRPTSPAVTPGDLFSTAIRHPSRWLLPAVLLGGAALVFATVRPRTWEASQTLLVRGEVSIDGKKDANSTRADDTKAAQETILELVHGQTVLKKALQAVGPSPKQNEPGFPTTRDAEDLDEVLKLVPPKGGEFGKTDIFYLKVQDHNRDRALALAQAVSERLQASFEELRATKAKSQIQELEKTVSLARAELEQSTQKLSQMERKVGGADLGELRIMNELPSGMSDLRNESFAIETELRKEFNEQIQNEQLLEVLKAATIDQGELIACPNNLLAAQPGLKRLKDGLVDAQIKGATLLGTMAPDHPQVVAAQEVAEQIGVSLHGELQLAIRAITADLQLSAERLEKLEQQKASLRARFDNLADIRAKYGNMAAMAKHRGEILKSAELELADARSKQAAAHTGALLQIIGEPVTGTRPVGPGRTAIVLAGTLGGLIIGMGIVVLTAKPQPFAALAETQQAVSTQSWANANLARTVTLDAMEQPTVEYEEYFTNTNLEPLSELAPEPEPVLAAVYQPATPALAPIATQSQSSFSGSPSGPLSFGEALQRIASAKGGL